MANIYSNCNTIKFEIFLAIKNFFFRPFRQHRHLSQIPAVAYEEH
jgi:hypothetical protein